MALEKIKLTINDQEPLSCFVVFVGDGCGVCLASGQFPMLRPPLFAQIEAYMAENQLTASNIDDNGLYRPR